MILEGPCCICKEHAKSMYSVIKHLDNGKTRFYNGHKRCLSILDSKLEKGEDIECEEIDTPRPLLRSNEN